MNNKSLIKAYYRGVREGLFRGKFNQDELKEMLINLIKEENEELSKINNLKSTLGYSRIGLNNV